MAEALQRRLVPIDEIKRGLVAQIEELCRDILPNGVRGGNEWRIGSPAGEPGRSMAVRLSGKKAGLACDFASGEAGDVLWLVSAVKCGGDIKAAVPWAVAWLGLDGGAPERFAKTREAVNLQQTDLAPTPDLRAAGVRRWREAQTILRGTPVEAYLRGRGIDFERLGRQPHFLRFHPRLWNVESRRHWPAMLGAVVDATAVICRPIEPGSKCAATE